jgi:uncharacterized protein
MPREGRISSMADNGPPPKAAATLYVGEVMHARLKPFRHRFAYKVFSLLIDIDRLGEAGRLTPLLAVNRPGFCSFRESDHVERKGESLRAYADRLLANVGLGCRASRILLLTCPRILGHVFNPISVYFAFDDHDQPVALVYDVRNTFGQRHAYVAPVASGEVGPAGIRQSRDKVLHVSPFIDMEARYHFRMLPPGKVVRMRIHETLAGEPLLAATFAGEARPLDTATLAGCLLKFPLLTWKIVAGIHWEALKLWLKGAKFHPSPAPTDARDRGAAAALEPGE